MLDEIWDFIVEGWENFIEGIQEIPEFFSGLFENIWEFSIPGIIGGIVMVFLTSMMLGKLDYFTQLSGISKILNGAMFYIVAFILGYIPVKRVFDM